MPRFDLSLWKSIHPASTEGSGIVAAIKDWQTRCPDKPDDPDTDPKRLVGVVAPVAKRFLAAITDAENKLNRDKSPDPGTKAKIAKTKALLAKWETEVTNYQKAITKRWQESIKEESEEKKSLQRAQLDFTTALVDGLQVAMGKMPGLAKTFDTLLKARRFDEAVPVLRDHRHLLMKALYLVKPVAVVKERTQAAAKHKVEPSQLNIPPAFNALVRRVQEMNDLDEDMHDRYERALEGEVDDEAEPGGASGPEYRKAVRELADACRSNAAKTKSKLSAVAQLAQSVKQIQAIPAAGTGYQKGVLGLGTLNRKMLALNKEMRALRDQAYRKGGSLQQSAEDAKLTAADEEKFLWSQARVATAYTKRFVIACEEASDRMEDWLSEVVAAHPGARDAQAELANVKARKYTVQLL